MESLEMEVTQSIASFERKQVSFTFCIIPQKAHQPSSKVCAIPEGMDPAEAAPLLCAGVTTFNSLRNMDLHAGDVVGVQGIG